MHRFQRDSQDLQDLSLIQYIIYDANHHIISASNWKNAAYWHSFCTLPFHNVFLCNIFHCKEPSRCTVLLKLFNRIIFFIYYSLGPLQKYQMDLFHREKLAVHSLGIVSYFDMLKSHVFLKFLPRY